MCTLHMYISEGDFFLQENTTEYCASIVGGHFAPTGEIGQAGVHENTALQACFGAVPLHLMLDLVEMLLLQSLEWAWTGTDTAVIMSPFGRTQHGAQGNYMQNQLSLGK